MGGWTFARKRANDEVAPKASSTHQPSTEQVRLRTPFNLEPKRSVSIRRNRPLGLNYSCRSGHEPMRPSPRSGGKEYRRG